MRIVFVMCVNMGYCKTGSVIDCHACPAADINLSVSSHTSGAGLLRPKPTLCLHTKVLQRRYLQADERDEPTISVRDICAFRWARAVRVVERCQSLLDCSRVFLVRAAARPRGSTTIQASP